MMVLTITCGSESEAMTIDGVLVGKIWPTASDGAKVNDMLEGILALLVIKHLNETAAPLVQSAQDVEDHTSRAS